MWRGSSDNIWFLSVKENLPWQINCFLNKFYAKIYSDKAYKAFSLVKVGFALEQAMKTQRGRNGIALLFL
jgi:hypothetical protein